MVGGGTRPPDTAATPAEATRGKPVPASQVRSSGPGHGDLGGPLVTQAGCPGCPRRRGPGLRQLLQASLVGPIPAAGTVAMNFAAEIVDAAATVVYAVREPAGFTGSFRR